MSLRKVLSLDAPGKVAQSYLHMYKDNDTSIKDKK